MRGIRAFARQPAFVVITLIQPMIWLLLFGQLFKRVVEIPGFSGGSYIDFLTPGVVVMTVLFSSGWAGMAFIEDMDRGVMDRNLTSPVSRGALIAGSLAHQAVSTVIQTLIIVGVALACGARFDGGVAGMLVLVAAAVLLALAFAALSDAVALLVRQQEALIGVSQFLVMPLTFLSSVLLAPGLMPGWVADVARFNPAEWAARAARAALADSPDWGVVGRDLGWLLLLALVAGWLATRAFRAYQRSA